MTRRNSSKPGRSEHGSPPTDLELMLWADGELDEGRAREVEAYVLRDASSRAKVAGMDVVGAAIREHEPSTLADGIADAVMARVEREGANGIGRVDAVRKRVNGVEPGADPASATRRLAPVAAPQQPANDSSARRIFVLAAIAAAVAAGLMIWGRMDAEPHRAEIQAPPSAEVVVVPAPSQRPAPEAPAAPGDEGEPGVEVAAVDFGARMGTIFYIPTGSSEHSPTTTVVWLSDEGTGGER